MTILQWLTFLGHHEMSIKKGVHYSTDKREPEKVSYKAQAVAKICICTLRNTKARCVHWRLLRKILSQSLRELYWHWPAELQHFSHVCQQNVK